MPGIIVMAGLTIFGSAILCITTLNSLTHSDRRYYWLVLAGLPLSFIVNKLFKIPVITGVGALAGIPLKLGPQMPVWFIIMIWLAAPIFEEAIKVLPVLLPTSRIFLRTGSNALWAGLALGFGFGMGEAVYLAYGMGLSPTYNQLPWHMFFGFASERIFITFGHGFLTSITVLGFYYGHKKAVFGYLAALGLHALINLGPILTPLKITPLSLANMGTYVTLLLTFLIFQHNLREVKKVAESRNGSPGRIYFEREL